MSSGNDDDIDIELDPAGDDYKGLIYGLYKRGNTYLIWLIIIGVVVLLFFVLRRAFK